MVAYSNGGRRFQFDASITAKNVNITTAGAHCAAIATDRGGADIDVTGGIMTTGGEGSPGIYSTGNITVTGATMTANGSEAAVIEGKNSITLRDTTLTAEKSWGVMLYQSFSGDAEPGTSVFKMKGGSLTAEEGPLFYTTNTRFIVNLDSASLASKSGVFLKAAAGRWGRSGVNSSDIALTAENESIMGDITCDRISTVRASLKNNTTIKGRINADHSARSINLGLDSTSRWDVTGTSYLTSPTDEDHTLSNITANGFTVFYDPRNGENDWLGKKTYVLTGGGKLVPQE